jgi:alpha-tubulin suppressor-like RCC1 family protein
LLFCQAGLTAHLTAKPVPGLSGVVDMHAGREHVVALKSDGTVWAWGKDNFGMVGDGTTTARKVPVQVSGLSNVVAVTTGHYHSMALKADGTVWAWGQNRYGQLGLGTTATTAARFAQHT